LAEDTKGNSRKINMSRRPCPWSMRVIAEGKPMAKKKDKWREVSGKAVGWNIQT